MTLAGNRFYDLSSGQPYNPASGDFTGPDYTLTGPDGTVYDLSTTSGNLTSEQCCPAGPRSPSAPAASLPPMATR